MGVESQRIPDRVYDIGAGFRAAGSETSCTQLEWLNGDPSKEQLMKYQYRKLQAKLSGYA
ncbi:MAG: hypothetical protein V3V08_14380 [Nannocystaceae bacterium]